MKKLVCLLLLVPGLGFASTGEVKLSKAHYNLYDKASLQRGAHTFVNYCLNCHSATYMRYNRLREIGLTEAQIKKNLLFTAEKVGDTMSIAMNKKEAKEWFGVAPPDLSVVSRSRGADWLYSYMRGFYRDPTTPTGWNNTVYPNVAMPHVLAHLQGDPVLSPASNTENKATGDKKLVLETQGKLSPAEYEKMVSDLVNFLVFMGEPAKTKRQQLGIIVLFLLVGLLLLSYLLKKEYWKDVH